MDLTQRISAFSKLGTKLSSISEDAFEHLSTQAFNSNRWFTSASVKNAFDGLSYMLEHEKLKSWLSNYDIQTLQSKQVGIVMAGNIPLVGFHDLLCVLMSGHHAVVKTSSQDAILPKQVIEWLIEIEPEFSQHISVIERLENIEAVIATGSDNTARYFEYYFGKYPNIIRKNRTSVAVLNGKETDEQLLELAKDIFDYYGLGCRNVSKLLIPEGYDIKHLLDVWQPYALMLDNNKYRNNYDYNKSILLINGVDHLDTGYSLLQESDQLVSPISITYYQSFSSESELKSILDRNQDKIQCIVGNDHIPFGKAQLPDVWEYADNVDTLKFLLSI
ncbi:MAG: acyl-CoA reductase [Cyclobacteriaceae bacterium]